MKVFGIVALWALALGAILGLSDQEAYYWLWSRRPELCYFEHPPFQAWMTRVFTWVFGDGTFGVRLGALVFMAATFWLFRLWVEERYSERAARLASCILLATFFFPTGMLLALPDSYFAFFAVATLYFSERRNSVAAGIALGLAALAKWTAAVLIPGVIVAFYARKNERRDLRGLVVTGLLAIALQAPVLYWNSQNGWASFLFHLSDRQKAWPGFEAALGHGLVFVLAQFVLGGLGVTLALWQVLRHPHDERPVEWRHRPSLLWWALPAFVIFGWSSIKGETRFYWTSVAFFPICAALGSRISAVRERGFKIRMTVGTVAVLAVVSLILLTPVGAWVKPFTDSYKRYDLRHSPRGDLDGWEAWARDVIRPLNLDREGTLFLSADFRIAAQGAWALRLNDVTRVNTVGPPFQFAFWPKMDPARVQRLVFFGDNRRGGDRGPLQARCLEAVAWQHYEVKVLGQLIKRIDWAVCEKPRL